MIIKRARRRRITPVLVAALLWLAALPATADAHAGPVAPVATSYIARVRHSPPGITSRVVDGDLEMWLQVPRSRNVVVLDFRGVPYLRFTRSGVQINVHSTLYGLNLYYLHEAASPPPTLGASTTPDWRLATGAHEFVWHDGRLQAFTSVAVAPGASYVGTWSIPLLIDGRRASISGGIWYAGRPSIAWFWVAFVLLACVLAGWRLRRPSLDTRLIRGLTATALASIVTIAVGQELHGRPTVSRVQVVELGVYLAFVAWAASRILVQEPSYLALLVTSFVVLWEGIEMLPTLLHGFVLLALPAFPIRVAAVLSLAAGPSLFLFALRIAGFGRQAAEWAVPAGTVN